MTMFWRCHSLSQLITVATYGYCHNPGRLNLMRAEMCIVMTRQRYLLSILEYWRGKFKQSKPSKRNLRFIPQPQLYSFPSAPFPSSVILLSAPLQPCAFLFMWEENDCCNTFCRYIRTFCIADEAERSGISPAVYRGIDTAPEQSLDQHSGGAREGGGCGIRQHLTSWSSQHFGRLFITLSFTRLSAL
jgi:hypothetical protein